MPENKFNQKTLERALSKIKKKKPNDAFDYEFNLRVIKPLYDFGENKIEKIFLKQQKMTPEEKRKYFEKIGLTEWV